MLDYAKLRVTFKSISDVVLSNYKGSTLRGMFKTALRRVCCPYSDVQCGSCTRAQECVYGTITEHRTKTGENTVLPYVINCSSLKRNIYSKDEALSFELVLVGRALTYLPHIIASLSAWDLLDVGRFQPLIRQGEIERYGPPADWPGKIRPKGRLRLETVEQISGDSVHPLYGPRRPFKMPVADTLLCKSGIDGINQQSIINNQQSQSDTLSCESGIDDSKWRVKLNFLAPTRITRRVAEQNGGKKKKKLIQPDDVDFHLFFNSIRTRIYGLCEHFGNGKALPAGEALKDAESLFKAVIVAENGLKMEKVRRYRGNMTKWVHLDGFVGPVTFENVAGSLIPWIMAGELLHIGRFPTLGFGEYRAEYVHC